MKRNPYITRSQEKVLRLLVDGPDEYIIVEGNEAWVESHRTNRQLIDNLLRLCLIKGPDMTGGAEIYTANQDTLDVLNDPNHVPRILPALEEARKRERARVSYQASKHAKSCRK